MPSFKSIALASIVLLVLFALSAVAQAVCQIGCTCGDPNCNCGETGQCESGAMSGSGPSSGGCYADPMTGEITCVDAQGSPVGSTGSESVPASGTISGGTITITTSGGYSGEPSSGYSEPYIDLRPGFGVPPEPGIITAMRNDPNAAENGGEQAANEVGNAAVAVIGAKALATAAAEAGLSAASAVTLPVLGVTALVAAAATAVAPIVQLGKEWIKLNAANAEAEKAAEGALKQEQELLNRGFKLVIRQ